MTKATFICEDCGLHYENEQDAKNCYTFCKEYNACSVEITKYSAEAIANSKKSRESMESKKDK